MRRQWLMWRRMSRGSDRGRPTRAPSPDWRKASRDRVEEAELRFSSWEWQTLTVCHSPCTPRLLHRMKSPLSKRLSLPGSSLACPQLPPDHLRPGSLAPTIGDHGPSDSALAAASAWRLRRPGADRHAARCASRDLCSGARHSAPCALERFDHAAVTIAGIELVHQIRKDQFDVSALCCTAPRTPQVWEAVLAA